jgi:antitoxin PrlF
MRRSPQENMRTKLTSKGQVTIPKGIRDRLGVRPGDKVQFFIDDRGRAVLEPTIKLRDIVGILPRPERSLTIEAIDKGIAEAAVERFRRSSQ